MTSNAHVLTGGEAIVTGRARELRPSVARALLVNVLLLGVAGDSLLRDGPSGLAFPLWIGVLSLNFVALVWKADRRVRVPAAAWLGGAFVFSLGLAWRNSEILQFFDVLATGLCLGMAALAASGRVADLVRTRGREARDTDSMTVALRAGAITTVLLFVFGALLRSADPIFASLLSIPDFDAANLVGHVLFSCFLAWLAAGWVRSALERPRAIPPFSLSVPPLGAVEIATALGALNLLFAAYVATQIAWFFGGETFLRDHTGLTAATYARSGFFQMVWVVLLVVPLLLGTRALIATERAAIRRHTALSIPLLALLAVMVLSAVLRMKMYVHFYGLTTDRLYPLVFMGWVSFVLLWLGGTVLRRRAGFLPGALLSGLVTLAALNAFDPDAFVARVNVDRAAHLGADKLDVQHLASLTGAAVPIATRIVLDARYGTDASQRCGAASTLLYRWGTNGARFRAGNDATWRFWNADDALATQAVAAHARELRAVKHTACAISRAGRR
jgi:hypothetical protein